MTTLPEPPSLESALGNGKKRKLSTVSAAVIPNGEWPSQKTETLITQLTKCEDKDNEDLSIRCECRGHWYAVYIKNFRKQYDIDKLRQLIQQSVQARLANLVVDFGERMMELQLVDKEEDSKFLPVTYILQKKNNGVPLTTLELPKPGTEDETMLRLIQEYAKHYLGAFTPVDVKTAVFDAGTGNPALTKCAEYEVRIQGWKNCTLAQLEHFRTNLFRCHVQGVMFDAAGCVRVHVRTYTQPLLRTYEVQ